MNKSVIPIISLIFVILISGCISTNTMSKGFSGGTLSCKPTFTLAVFPSLPRTGATANDYMKYIIDIFIWINATNLLLCVIIPILGVFFITLGFLETIRIFKDSWINVALAILIGLSFTSLGPLNWVIGQLFRGMGTYGVIIFAVMFVVGTYLLYQRRKAEWGTQVGIANAFKEESNLLKQQLRAKREEYAKLLRELGRSNMLARVGIRKRMNELDVQINDLIDRLKEMKEQYET